MHSRQLQRQPINAQNRLVMKTDTIYELGEHAAVIFIRLIDPIVSSKQFQMCTGSIDWWRTFPATASSDEPVGDQRQILGKVYSREWPKTSVDTDGSMDPRRTCRGGCHVRREDWRGSRCCPPVAWIVGVVQACTFSDQDVRRETMAVVRLIAVLFRNRVNWSPRMYIVLHSDKPLHACVYGGLEKDL